MSTACRQTGCPGTYVDGYCDYCGFPAPADVASAATTDVPTATAASTLADEQARGLSPTGPLEPPQVGPHAPPPAAPGGSGGSGPAGAPGVPGFPAATGARPVPSGPGGIPQPSARTGSFPPERPAIVTPPAGPGRAGAGAAGIALGSARGTGMTRRLGPGLRRARRSSLGAGLVAVPAAPSADPAKAVLTDPEVPEDKRNCPSCGAPVGRGHADLPGRTQGYCPQCRKPYSFTPKLAPGDLVGGQYEVVGCLAHGGLGWIYLARDKNVSDRWVVLKGLLNTGDADALDAAVAEQRFLAQVEHPLIVAVYNVVTYAGAGYTVMEYVGGTSLKQLLKDRMAANGGVYDPLPVAHALAFVLEILPAFAYLHDLGLLYCDFKPDNLIQVGDSVRLIDLGGMRRADDLDSPIYGTVGYQAPEIAELGPSIPSDIYTIGRSLAVLTNEFRGYQSTYATSLPPAAKMPAFAQYDAFYRLVAKACALDPADRFPTIEEFRVQAYGVLRQVVSESRDGTRDGTRAGVAATSVASTLFDAPVVTGDSLGWWELPALRPDEHDPMLDWLRSVRDLDPQRRLEHLASAGERSAEVLLEEGRTQLALGHHHGVTAATDELLKADPWDWRALWLVGLDALSRDDHAAATAAFTTVYGQVPGELAPRLALGLTHELAGARSAADADYLACLRTDSAYTTAAAFGLARLRSAQGDFRGAVTALGLVPAASAAAGRARWLRAELSIRLGGDLDTYEQALRDAERLDATPIERAGLRVRALEGLLEYLGQRPAPRDRVVAGIRATARPVRLALHDAYLALAALHRDPAQRAALVDTAHRIRPWSLT